HEWRDASHVDVSLGRAQHDVDKLADVAPRNEVLPTIDPCFCTALHLSADAMNISGRRFEHPFGIVNESSCNCPMKLKPESLFPPLQGAKGTVLTGARKFEGLPHRPEHSGECA